MPKKLLSGIITDTNHVCNGIALFYSRRVCALFTPVSAKPPRDTASWYEKVRGSSHTTHSVPSRGGPSSILFYTMRNRGPRAPRRQGKVARAICPRPDCGSAVRGRRRRRRGERGRKRGTHKNQTPKALPSWHASTSQPLSLNRITSRGFDGISPSISSFTAHRSFLCFFSPLPSSLPDLPL